MWAKRRLLQCVSYQFQCAKTFKLWDMWENDDCHLCRRLKIEGTVDTESLGHAQCHCPALQRPRIAVHHGIWRELHVAISQWSKEKPQNDDNLEWGFPQQ